MSEQQRLLLISDPRQLQSPALESAAALAEATGAALHILVCDNRTGTHWLLDEQILDQMREGILEHQLASLEELSEHLRTRGIQATFEFFSADEPEKDLFRSLETSPVDLVIKPTRHELALKRAFITPLDWQLLRNCPVPLHLVSTAQHPLPRKVVAAVDLSRTDAEGVALNEHLVSVGENFAQQCGAKLHLVMAYEQSQPAQATAPLDSKDAAQGQHTGNLHGAFNQFAERRGVPEHRRHFLPGTPARSITEFSVCEEVDVVVMGTLTHKGLDKVLGSTAEQVLNKVPAIIAVRPPEP
jgi:universal stress protein E